MKSIVVSFTFWVTTALLNALSGGTILFLFSQDFEYWPKAFSVVFIFTLILSMPGVFIFCIAMLINKNRDLLFRCMLQKGLIISALSSLLVFILPDDVVGGRQLFLSCSIVIASVTSIMIHHTNIKSIAGNKPKSMHSINQNY